MSQRPVRELRVRLALKLALDKVLEVRRGFEVGVVSKIAMDIGLLSRAGIAGVHAVVEAGVIVRLGPVPMFQRKTAGQVLPLASQRRWRCGPRTALTGAVTGGGYRGRRASFDVILNPPSCVICPWTLANISRYVSQMLSIVSTCIADTIAVTARLLKQSPVLIPATMVVRLTPGGA